MAEQLNNQRQINQKPKQLGIIFSLAIFVLGMALIVFVNRLFNDREPELVDNDGDGYYTIVVKDKQKDCDDSNDAIFPGANDIPGDGIDQDCNGEDAPFVFDPSDFDNSFKEYNEYLELDKIKIYDNPIVTPNIISDATIKAISRRIETKGKFEKAYLYVSAGIEEKNNPLTNLDSIYFYFDTGKTGGHLLRIKTLPIELETDSTELLYDANNIPVINLPYTDNPKAERITRLNLLEILNSENGGYNRKHYIGAFISTTKFGNILNLSIAYKCVEGSDCGIKTIR